MKTTIELELNLGFKKCKPHQKGDVPLKIGFIKGYLSQLPGWKLSGKKIVRLFGFRNFYETMGFVNAVAYIANRENHHPDLEAGYKTCRVSYSTHEAGGLTLNDFVCATKIDELLGISEEGEI
jgi:4a-hydroxytetrahydrobiopterin dehydratase